jgi:hypothetical protein
MQGDEKDRFLLLEGRIAGLESKNRSMRSVLVLLLAGALGAICLGSAVERGRLEAKEIRLLDDHGRMRASLHMKDGSPGLVFYDRQGGVRLEVSVGQDDAPGICLYDEAGQGRASLEMIGDSSHLHFNARKGKELVALGLNSDETTYLHLFSQKKKEYWTAP